MKRISCARASLLKDSLLGSFLKLNMIPYVVRSAAAAVSPLLSSKNAALRSNCVQTLKPALSPFSAPQALTPSVAANECGSCRHLSAINQRAQLVPVDHSSKVYQLLPPGPLITLKNGFVLSGFGRWRSMERSIPPPEESLRA